MEDFGAVNWLAVVAGSVVAFLVGWLWYSKLFGKIWMEGSNLPANAADDVPVVALVTNFVALFLMALVVGITATSNALITAVLAILAVAVYAASMGGFVKKSRTAILIDFSYVVVAGVVMIVAQGVL